MVEKAFKGLGHLNYIKLLRYLPSFSAMQTSSVYICYQMSALKMAHFQQFSFKLHCTEEIV